MPFEFHDPATWFGIGRALAALWLFHFPGYLLTSALHRDEGYSWPFRIAFGWAWSFAVFAPVAWLFLWNHGTMTSFLWVLGCVWVAYTVLACHVWRQARRADLTSAPSVVAAGEPVVPPRLGVRGVVMLLVLLLYVRICFFCADLSTGSTRGWLGRLLLQPLLEPLGFNPDTWQFHHRTYSEWIWFGVGGLVVVAVGILVACGCRWALRSWLEFTSRDEATPAWTALGLALAMIFAQAASAAVFDRPDSDDCYYLAFQLDYMEGGPFNLEEPTHREGLPVHAHNMLLSWDLWAAVVCLMAGLNPMAVSHSILPPLLVLLCYAAYWQVLKEYVPGRWVPLALLGLSAYFVWGIGSHHAASNYLLPRLWQGKAVLAHLAVPLIIVTQTRFMRKPTPCRWLGLLAAVVSGLAVSSTGVFLCMVVVVCLAFACVPTLSWQDAVRGGVGSAAACVPCVLYGLAIRQRVLAEGAFVAEGFQWEAHSWFSWLLLYVKEGGNWEFFWLLVLPLLAVFLGSWRRLTYPVGFFAILLLTFNNPLLSPWVANHFTSVWGYFRLFWLWPVAVGIGILLALMARLLLRILEGLVRVRLEHPRLGGLPELLVLGGLWMIYDGLSGIYVWSERNGGTVYPWREHPVTPNLMKMPPDLVVIADTMLADADIDHLRVLCPDEVSSYFTPYSRRFRFAQTRTLYTYALFRLGGREAEGAERYLVGLILAGKLPQGPGEKPFSEEHPYGAAAAPIPDPPRLLTAPVILEMLRDLRVRYAVFYTDPEGGSFSASVKLTEAGFKPQWKGSQFTLWKRLE